MQLQRLSLINFKNFKSQEFEFDHKINCFVGQNGIGKTNALDAIYLLAFGKSYFNPIASQNIHHDENFFVVDGTFIKDQRTEKIICSFKKSQKKLIKRNGKQYDKLSDHLGLIPLVIISPSDRDLITEGSEMRRKFIDSVISQGNKIYLQNLINYNKVLLQRNALLKYFALNNTFNQDTLSVYDDQLQQYGTEIHLVRKNFLEKFIPIFKERYMDISSGKETVGLTYQSQLEYKELGQLFKEYLNKDKALQYTSVGTHKDDLIFEIDGHPIKKFGSQGQQKSYLVALKLAQFDFTKQQSGQTPILLLDDIFDKLDEKRVSQIIHLVNKDSFGQIFISDTHRERTENVVKQAEQSYRMIEL